MYDIKNDRELNIMLINLKKIKGDEEFVFKILFDLKSWA